MGGFSIVNVNIYQRGKPALFSAMREFSTFTERLNTSPLRSASPSALRWASHGSWGLNDWHRRHRRERDEEPSGKTSGTGGFVREPLDRCGRSLELGHELKHIKTASYWTRWTGGYQGDLGVWNWVLKTLFLWWVFVIGWTWWWTSGSST